jgi:hypothetical protein
VRKTFWWALFVMGIIAAAEVRSDEENKKPDAPPPQAERKAAEPAQDKAKKEEAKKEDRRAVERRTQRRRTAVEEAVLKEDWDKVLAGLDEIIADKEIDENERLSAMYDKFTVLTEEKLDGAKACPLAKKISELAKDDANMLNDISWTILDTEGLKHRDLDLALTIARRANDLTRGQSGEILDTLARAHFEKGNLRRAVELQTQAVAKLKKDADADDDVKEEVQATLDKYKAKLAEKMDANSGEKTEPKNTEAK